MKLKDKLDLLKASAPKHSRYGQMYKQSAQLKRKFKRVRLHTLFVSDENTHLLRAHLFESKRARTPAQWSQWFAEHLRKIHETDVLSGLALRTGKTWAVQRIIGWIGDAKYSTDNSKVAKRRHKAKS